MGHRANFVVIRSGEARAYYDQWAALGCVFELAPGPEHASRSAEQMTPASELMDWAFAEGGYLIDFDQKHAIVFGEPLDGEIDLEEFEILGEIDPAQIEEEMAISRALQNGPLEFLKSIAPRWEGWLLRWDDRGVDAFAEHLDRRGIRTIATQPASHPPDLRVVSWQA